MDIKLFACHELQIFRRGDRFFVRYDAGAHQIAMREDEISEAELGQAMLGREHALQMIFNLENRLVKSGENPYVSNLVKKSA
jgi:hypothetical protein